MKVNTKVFIAYGKLTNQHLEIKCYSLYFALKISYSQNLCKYENVQYSRGPGSLSLTRLFHNCEELESNI